MGNTHSSFCWLKKGEDMRCPYCGSVDDKVVESRTLGQGDCIRRRRSCLNCGYRFTTERNTGFVSIVVSPKKVVHSGNTA